MPSPNRPNHKFPKLPAPQPLPETDPTETEMEMEAEPDSTEAEATLTSPSPPPDFSVQPVPGKPIKQQARAIQARWAGEAAAEEELRQHFLTIPLEKALPLLDKMRKNCELAGKILNERINVPEIQKCKTCGKTYDQLIKSQRMRDWFLNRPHYDPKDRNIILVDHFCSAACVSLENNRTQGVRGIADRGMLASENPKFHPHLPKE